MPKIVNHDLRREELAAATWRALARRGLEATTVRLVAEEAGTSTGVLAHYFRDKNDLLLFALRLASTRAAGRMMVHATERTGIDALRAVSLEGLPLDRERRLEWRVWLAFWGQAVVSATLAAEQRHRYDAWRRLIGRLLSDALGKRAVRVDVESEADALIAFIDGTGIQATFEPRRMTPQRQTDAIDRYLERLLRR